MTDDTQADLEPEFKELLAKWGTEDDIYAFFDRELEILGPLICGSGTPLPKVMIVPSSFVRGPMYSNAAADYEPDFPGSGPIIGMSPSVLMDEGVARRVLAHELIHHWEHIAGHDAPKKTYPKKIDELISKSLGEPEASWRGGHSSTFIAKAVEVAKQLDPPIERLLFRKR